MGGTRITATGTNLDASLSDNPLQVFVGGKMLSALYYNTNRDLSLNP